MKVHDSHRKLDKGEPQMSKDNYITVTGRQDLNFFELFKCIQVEFG